MASQASLFLPYVYKWFIKWEPRRAGLGARRDRHSFLSSGTGVLSSNGVCAILGQKWLMAVS